MGFDELDERGVIHRDVRDVMPSGERRDDHIRHAEADFARRSLSRQRHRPEWAPGAVGFKSQ